MRPMKLAFVLLVLTFSAQASNDANFVPTQELDRESSGFRCSDLFLGDFALSAQLKEIGFRGLVQAWPLAELNGALTDPFLSPHSPHTPNSKFQEWKILGSAHGNKPFPFHHFFNEELFIVLDPLAIEGRSWELFMDTKHVENILDPGVAFLGRPLMASSDLKTQGLGEDQVLSRLGEYNQREVSLAAGTTWHSIVVAGDYGLSAEMIREVWVPTHLRSKFMRVVSQVKHSLRKSGQLCSIRHVEKLERLVRYVDQIPELSE